MIAEAAACEFLSRGYAGASMAAIASRLGLTKGALVYHFPAKADFVDYFVGVVRDVTQQARDIAVETYPDSGVERMILFHMLMDHWREGSRQIDAGVSLFMDSAAPSLSAEDLSENWLRFYEGAFAQCAADGGIRDDLSPLDAAEALVLTSLGTTFFGHLFRTHSENVKPLRFLRNALRSVGIQNVDELADRVFQEHGERLPEPVLAYSRP